MTQFNSLMALLVLLTGFMCSMLPRIEPPTECFAVTVPPSAKDDSRVASYRRTYSVATTVITIVCAVAFLLCARGVKDPASPEGTHALSVAITAATLVPLACAFGLMLHFRSRMRSLKQAEGWVAEQSRAVAALGGEPVPQPLPLAWNLLHAVVVALMVVVALVTYDQLPEQIPIHMGPSGAIDTYAPKSLTSVMFPALMCAFLGLTFTLCHWGIVNSKRPVDPAAPATSALAYGTFARAQSILMLVGGLAISACMGIVFFLPALGVITLGTAATIMMGVTLAFAAAMVFVSIELGQSGARMAAELRPSDQVARDDDAHWYLGSIYYNPDDPTIFVPKRFGVGWTTNMARPESWLIIFGITFGSVALVLIAARMMG